MQGVLKSVRDYNDKIKTVLEEYNEIYDFS